MKLYGLIGLPLGHSFSARYFADKFAAEGVEHLYDYRLFELPRVELLRELLSENPSLAGVNVTIPYKQSVMPLLDRLSPEAERIGAVNCIKVEEGGILTGYNTDYLGFGCSLVNFLKGERPAILVLGTGGASKAVCTWLDDNGYDYLRVSHSGKGDLSYTELTADIVADHKLIINATPLGMSPDVATCPQIPYDSLSADHYLFDLVYNPPQTEFLRRGAERGAHICNGLEMLRLQAEESWRIWTK